MRMGISRGQGEIQSIKHVLGIRKVQGEGKLQRMISTSPSSYPGRSEWDISNASATTSNFTPGNLYNPINIVIR